MKMQSYKYPLNSQRNWGSWHAGDLLDSTQEMGGGTEPWIHVVWPFPLYLTQLLCPFGSSVTSDCPTLCLLCIHKTHLTSTSYFWHWAIALALLVLTITSFSQLSLLPALHGNNVMTLLNLAVRSLSPGPELRVDFSPVHVHLQQSLRLQASTFLDPQNNEAQSRV